MAGAGTGGGSHHRETDTHCPRHPKADHLGRVFDHSHPDRDLGHYPGLKTLRNPRHLCLCLAECLSLEPQLLAGPQGTRRGRDCPGQG